MNYTRLGRFPTASFRGKDSGVPMKPVASSEIEEASSLPVFALPSVACLRYWCPESYLLNSENGPSVESASFSLAKSMHDRLDHSCGQRVDGRG